MFDRLPCDRWVDRRFALKGDAAHPMLQYLAQGAGQAIEDAQSVAAMVSDFEARGASLDCDAALRNYERARTVRTAEVQTIARGWGELWHCDGLARALRDELFRLHDPRSFLYTDWLYGQASAADRPLEGSQWAFGVGCPEQPASAKPPAGAAEPIAEFTEVSQ
jgi:salicylate hydroxylase